ncbi:MAG: amino acid adenylation domain-containing protein, partial [Gammaproteobacteria bacterium]|nr:amino acid adenylation domain-containing protein [Gammaproteobacteria bacterium]
VRLPPIEAQPEDDPEILSFAQQRLWFLNQFEEGSSATYNIPAALQLSGQLDLAALQQSLHWLQQRHVSLRTCFPTHAGQARILPVDRIEALQIHDLRRLTAAARSDEVQNRANRHAAAPFDLAQGPLFKADLLQVGEHRSVLLLNMHHIISDGWSMGVFIRDWQHAYTSFAQGEQPGKPPLPVQYSDYAAWQRDWLQGAVLQQQVDYWRGQLTGVPELLELPTDKPRPPGQSYQGAHYARHLSPALSQAALNLSRQQGVSLFMTLLTTFNILLSRYSRQNDFCVGSPIANRTHSQTEDIIGFFANTLVLRSRVPTQQEHGNQPQSGFIELLRETRKTCLEAYAHQDIPFEMLVEQLQPTRSLSHSPLFQVMLVLQNNEPLELTLPGLEITALTPDYPIAKFDLMLNVEEQNDGLYCSWEYATDLFYPETIERMAGHFEVLLTALVENPQQPVSQLPMLTEKETRQLLAWNDTAADYPLDKTIVDLFEQQVEKTPSNIAAVFEKQQLTYQQLNDKANQLAHHLLALKPRAGISSSNPLTAIVAERSLEMVIGLLGILKAGGAYVPIDPGYPAARIQYMLEDSAAPLLLTQSHLKVRLSLEELTPAGVVICLDEADFTFQPTDNPDVNSEADDLAYVIYTSGSTGRPKGVMVGHSSVVNLLNGFEKQAPHLSPLTGIFTVPFSFDLSVWEIFSQLCYGGALHVLSRETLLETNLFVNYLLEKQISSAYIPPVLLELAANQLKKRGNPLQRLLVGVEPISQKVLQEFRVLSDELCIINGYGPTEATVCASFYKFTHALESERRTPIGKPAANYRIYILSVDNQPQPPGIPGELCIAGAGLARGYLNRPELTAEKFMEAELFGKTERIYKTGDLARWLPD